MLLVEDRADRGGHRPEVHRDVLGLHDHLAMGVEQGGRRVASLLDVRRVRRADEHGAHLLTDRPERATQHLQLDGVDHRVRSSLIVPLSMTSPDHPWGMRSVDSGSSITAGPASAVPGSGTAETTSIRSSSPSSTAARRLRRTDASARVGGEWHLDGGRRGGHPHGHELELLLGIAVAVTIAMLGFERLSQRVRRRLDTGPDRQLERLAAVAQLVGRVQFGLGTRLAERRPGLLAELARHVRDHLCLQVLAAQEHAVLDVAPPRRDDEPERCEDAGCAWAQDRRDPEFVGDRGGMERAGPSEGEQRIAPGVDATLDGDDAQRPDHLGVRHADDPLGARDRVELELAGEAPDRVG